MSARQPKNNSVELWKPQDVADWFRQNKLEDCVAVVWRNKIDGKTLLNLHPSVLQMFPEKARMKVQSLTKSLGEQPRTHWNKFSSKQSVPNPPEKDYTAQPPATAHAGDDWPENEFDTEDDDYEEPDADQSLPQITQESSDDDNYEEPDVEGPDYDDPSKMEDDYEQTPCETQKYPPISATSIGGNDKDYIDKGSISIKSSKITSSEFPSDDAEDQEDYVVPVENIPNEGCLPSDHKLNHLRKDSSPSFLKGDASPSVRPGPRLKPSPPFPHPLLPKPVLDGSPSFHKPLLPSTSKPGSDNSQVFLKTRSLEKTIQESSSTTKPHTLPKALKMIPLPHPKPSSARSHPPHTLHLKPSHHGGPPMCPPKPNFNTDAPPIQANPGGGGLPFGRKGSNGHGSFSVPVPERPVKPKGYLPVGHASMHGPLSMQAGHRPAHKVLHEGITQLPPLHQHALHPEDHRRDTDSDNEDYEIPNEEETIKMPPKICDHMNRYPPPPTPPPPSRPAPLGPPPVDRVSKPNSGGRSPLMNKDSPSEISTMPRSPLLPHSSRKSESRQATRNLAGHKLHLPAGSIKKSQEDLRVFSGDAGSRQGLGHRPSFSSRGGAPGGPPHSVPTEINNCDRKTAEAMVKNTNKDGAFMVRTSSKDKTNQPYTLVIYYEERIFNIPIRYLEKYNKYALGTEKAKEEKFDSIHDIIEYYKKQPLLLIGGQHGVKKSTLLIQQVRI